MKRIVSISSYGPAISTILSVCMLLCSPRPSSAFAKPFWSISCLLSEQRLAEAVQLATELLSEVIEIRDGQGKN
jgi:hypothetical protein